MTKERQRLGEPAHDNVQGRIGASLREAYRIDNNSDAQMQRLIEQMKGIEGTRGGQQ